jgi:hypothetical protein
LWQKSSEQYLPTSIAGVLRLRYKTSLWDRYARRFAQDDGLVRVLKQYVSNRLARTGLRPGLRLARAATVTPGNYFLLLE